MSLGLRLEGRRDAETEPAAFLERAARWLSERKDDDPQPRATIQDEGGELLLAVDLHPGAESLLLEAHDASVVLEANTGTAGPGYHRHVCALARALGEALGVEWTAHEDVSGFFESGDDEVLERAFLALLQSVAEQIRELSARGHRGLSLFMPMGHAYEHDGLVTTVLGPRDEAWLARAIEEPASANDIFPWWSEGRNGRYYLDLARVHMWLDVRWRPPLDDDERALLDRIATWIERAHALDAELPIPWEEQAEILALLGEESLRATRSQLKAAALPPGFKDPIGYRRRPVRVSLSGGWSLRIPGELAERWDERGTWVGWDERRSVWFTSMTLQAAPGHPEPTTEETLSGLPPLTGEDLLEMERDDLRGLACFVSEEHEGQLLHRLEAHAARGPHAAVGTIVLADEADRDWALETWGSLLPPRG